LDALNIGASVSSFTRRRQMRNLLMAVIAALLGACIASAGPSPSGPPRPRESRGEPRILEGIVRDALTHQPIDRASVNITGRGIQGELTAQTGPDGRFRTGEIPRGELAIRVRHEGYEPSRATVTNDAIEHVDVELVPTRQ
jgi:hypothetical protein